MSDEIIKNFRQELVFRWLVFIVLIDIKFVSLRRTRIQNYFNVNFLLFFACICFSPFSLFSIISRNNCVILCRQQANTFNNDKNAYDELIIKNCSAFYLLLSVVQCFFFHSTPVFVLLFFCFN